MDLSFLQDQVFIQAIIGVVASAMTQVSKREKAGALENILLAFGLSVGVGKLGAQFSFDPNSYLMPALFAYATHGILGDQIPMRYIKFAAIDRTFEGLGKALSSINSRATPPPSSV